VGNEEESIMTKQLMKAVLMLSLPLAVVLATPPSHADLWRNSEPQAPVKKASTTKQAATTKKVSGTKLAASAKPAPATKASAPTKAAATAKASATAKGGAQVTQAATSIGSDGQVVYHSISDWQPGSLNRPHPHASSADPRGGPRTRDGKSRERAVEVALSSVQP